MPMDDDIKLPTKGVQIHNERLYMLTFIGKDKRTPAMRPGLAEIAKEAR